MKRITILSIFLLSLTNLSLFKAPTGEALITPFLIISPVLIMIYTISLCNRLPKLASPSLTLLAIYILATSVIHLDTARWSSIIYSLALIGTLGFYKTNAHHIKSNDVEKLSKLIIATFFASTAIAAIIYNMNIQNEFLTEIFKTYNDGKTVRPHGLSSEPSYAAFISCISLHAYLITTKDTLQKRFLWTTTVTLSIILYSSAYGYILLAICLYPFLKSINTLKYLRKLKHPTTALFAIISIVTLYIIIHTASDHRLVKIFSYLASGNFNINGLRLLDSSAHMRIGPTLALISSPEFWSFSSLIGHGAGASSYYFGSTFEDAIAVTHRGYERGTIDLGFIPAFLYDYGIIGVALTTYLVSRTLGHRNITGWLFFVLISFNANLNTQLFFFFLAIATIIKNTNPECEKARPYR